MIVGTCTVYMAIGHANSLKEKRTVVKSLIQRLQNKFNISVAEVLEQDYIKSAVIGFSCVTTETKHANSIIQKVINYMEENSEAEIVDVAIEIF